MAFRDYQIFYMDQDLELLKKKLLYQANYRGIKEVDLILGGFVKLNINHFSSSELSEMNKLIEVNDYDLVAWLMGNEASPIKISDSLLEKFNNYSYYHDKNAS